MRRISPSRLRAVAVALTLACGLPAGACASAPNPEAAAFRQRLPQDEVVYFVLPDRFANGDAANDRGGLPGGPLDHGFDPTRTGFYHGGDLAGLTARLDYIQGLGATAIWLGPVYQNKPVQGAPGSESAGYHGYWITDFTRVDPHFGDDAAMRAFVDAAHARGMKVYLDIITNHTADVLRNRECEGDDCVYRSLGDYPYSRHGGVDGAAINEGFLGDQVGTAENFARLTRPDYAYTPYAPAGEESVKVPAWLNDPALYHNRGNTTFRGESSTYGDFAGLDDLFTEHPQVVAGMIDIFGGWIDRYGIDGFRVDTVKHVDSAFWQAFVPAMLERAHARGIPNFHIFAEAYEFEPGVLARFTREDRFPAVLDFAFQGSAAEVIAKGGATEKLARLYMADAAYEGGAPAAMALPTFLGNHDMGRFAHFVRDANPDASDDEVLKRVVLGHALMMFGRGSPTIYYGDEQGFAGTGGDQASRQDMFAGAVDSYNAQTPLGGAAGSRDRYDTDAPLYRAIAGMAAVRAAEPALRRGEQRVRAYGDDPGLFAFSRILDGREVLVVLNTGAAPLTANIAIDPRSLDWTALHGACASRAVAPGSLRVSLQPFDYMVCASGGAQ